VKKQTCDVFLHVHTLEIGAGSSGHCCPHIGGACAEKSIVEHTKSNNAT